MPAIANARETIFTRLSDGTVLRRHSDGTYRLVTPESDTVKLAALVENEIERMAASDPDHPTLDDTVWDGAPAPTGVKEAVSMELDSDVLRYFRKDGHGYQARINAVLRRYVRANEISS